MTEPPVVVLDSNVLWSAGVRAEFMDAAMAGRYVPVWSDWIIAETWRILTEKWLVKQGRPSKSLSSAAKAMMRIMAPLCALERSLPRVGPGAWPSLGDPDDEPIWNTALHANADFVVSKNTADFPPADGDALHIWEGIEYLTPEAFLVHIGWPGVDEDAEPVAGGLIDEQLP